MALAGVECDGGHVFINGVAAQPREGAEQNGREGDEQIGNAHLISSGNQRLRGTNSRSEQPKKQHGRDHWYAPGKEKKWRCGNCRQSTNYQKNAQTLSGDAGPEVPVAEIF